MVGSMTVLHVFNNSIYTAPYIEFINRNFNSSDHTFFMIKSPSKMKIQEADNLLNFTVDKRRSKLTAAFLKTYTYISLIFECLKADKIIIHALFDSSIIKFFYYNKYFLKKSYWAIWGADLYDSQKSKNKKKNEHKEFMKRSIIKKMAGLIGLPGDRLIAKEKYGASGKEFDIIYANAIKAEFLDKLKHNGKEIVFIQIGNSADPSNLHIELLDILAGYRDEKIQIFAPLSYGDEIYAQKVKEYGEKIFGKKFTAMMTYLTPEEYSEYLGDIDIMVFNHKRQQGLGNIFPLIYLGKKVFIREDTSSWSFFQNELNVKLFDTNKINRIGFKDFIGFSTEDRNSNIRRAKETIYSEEYIKNLWLKVFSG